MSEPSAQPPWRRLYGVVDVGVLAIGYWALVAEARKHRIMAGGMG